MKTSIAAELESTLQALQSLQMQQKQAAEQRSGDSAVDKGVDNGNKPQPALGERGKEMTGDVSKQQELSQQKAGEPAKSPVTGTAAAVGTAEEIGSKADSQDGKKDKPDDEQRNGGTKDKDLSMKTAAALSEADELIKLAEESCRVSNPDGGAPGSIAAAEAKADKDKAEAVKIKELPEGGKKDGDKPSDTPPAAVAAAAQGTADELEKNAAAVDQLLPADVDPAAAAAIPNLPSDEGELKKLAAEDVSGYIKTAAEVYKSDVRSGAAFAANFHAGLMHLAKVAAEEDQELAQIVKLANDDAQQVAELLSGMGGGMPAGMPGHAEPDGDEGGQGDGDGDGDDAGAGDPSLGGEGGDPGAAGGGAPGSDPGENPESILAALQAAGVDPAQLAKTAAAAGLDEAKVTATLAKLKKR